MNVLSKIASSLALVFTLISCNNEKPTPAVSESPSFQNKGHELVYKMVQKVGNYSDLAEKKNVSYTYTYTTPDGLTDISQESYIFNGELSYGKYIKHERTLPQLEGPIEQGYDGKEYWLKHKGKVLDNPDYLKRVAFNRPTNFYWFSMMQKLLDPGLNYEYLGEVSVDDKPYDVVKITFDAQEQELKDIYQLYINKETLLVDQFLFTVADFGKMEPKLMQVEYEEVDGILSPTKRKYKNLTWTADVTDEPWITVSWTDIQFNTPELTKARFEK